MESSLSFRHQPFLYLAAALIAGILSDRFSEARLSVIVAAVIASTLVSVALFFMKKDGLTTASALVTVSLLGASLSFAERNGVSQSRLRRLFDQQTITADEPVELTGILALPPEPAPEARYIDLEAQTVRARGREIIATGRVRLILHLNDAESAMEFERLDLRYGSRIRALVRLERARGFLNPGSPDFNEYLELAGYDLRGAIKSPLLIENIGPWTANPILDSLYKARHFILRAIDAHFHQPTAGTLKAMLTGNRYFLDSETSERLRESSTYHALSISGMHIGIIAWFLLGGWRPRKRKGASRVILCLLALWAYAVMVGLAPPVTRATVMITVGLIGPLLFRRGASINTVALAAFAMLALKPSLVADPGFQLSFIAVAAIVSIAMPVIDRLRSVGEWRPTPETPHPPSCSRALRLLSESLFWNEREFREEMSRSVIRYRAHKSAVARALGLWRVQPVIRGAAVLIITSAAIQIATLPLTAFYFNRAAPVGVMLNVAAGLFTALLMFSGVAAIAIGAISQPIAGLFEKLGDLAHYLLVNEIAPFRWIPGATFRVAHYEGEGAFWYFAFYVPIFFLIVLIDRWRPVAFKREVPLEKANVQRSRGAGEQGSRRSLAYALICMTAVIAGCVMIVRPAGSDHDGKLRIHFLDVGQGDAALIVFPGGSTMLIDAGGDFDFTGREMNIEDEETERGFRDNAHSIGEMVVSRFLWSKGLTEIDYALATHAHIDHIGGLTDAVRNFQPGQLILARAPADSLKMTRLVDLCSERRIPLGAIGAGDRFEIEGVRVETLWPERGEDIGSESGNDESIVLRIVYGSASVLLAGDIEQETEASLLRSVDDLRADVLKVPHHGSRSSSTQRFIDAVSPRWAVISVGERSRFGHPHREVIDRYKDKGVTVLQTGRDGMVTVESDGASIDVRTFGPR